MPLLQQEQLQKSVAESEKADDMEGFMISTEVQTGEELLDAEVALAKRMEREWMEEKKRLQNELRDAQAFMFKTPQGTKAVEEKDTQSLTDEEQGSPENVAEQSPSADDEQVPAVVKSFDTENSFHMIDVKDVDVKDEDVPHLTDADDEPSSSMTDGINEQITLATRHVEEQSAPPHSGHSGGNKGGIDVDTQTVTMEMMDNGTSTSQDKLLGNQDNNTSMDGVVDANVEVETGAIDNIQKFFTGLFGNGPRAKGIQTEAKPITERISQTDIGEKYFKEKEVLEQKLKDSESLAEEMSKSLKSMAMTDKAWEAAKRLQSVDGESQTDIDLTEMVFLKDHAIGPASEEEVESLKAQVSQLEAEKEVLGEKLRASKALSEVMSASMQSLTKPGGDRDKVASPDGQVLEDECEVGAADNFYLRLIETDEGELETVKIPTGRVGGYSGQEKPQQLRRVVSDDMKGLLQDIEDEEYSDGQAENEFKSNDEAVEEMVLSAQIQASEFSMPKISQLPQVDQGTQTPEGENDQRDAIVKVDCGVMANLTSVEDELISANNAQSSPDDEVLRKDVISISPEKVELKEDGDGNLQACNVKSDHQKQIVVGQDEILGEFANCLEDTIDADKDNDDWEEISKDEQVQEETVKHRLTQPTEFQMPHMPSALQKEQGVQTDLLEKDRNSNELGPEGGLLKKSIVDLAYESFELKEDDYGRLRSNQAKTDKPKIEEIDRQETFKEMADHFGLNDVEKDVNEWGFSDDGDNDEDSKLDEIKEETVKHQLTRPTEFQMPHMPSALQKEQGVQVDLLEKDRDSNELGPEGGLLKKSVVNFAYESFELKEDDYGRLSSNQAKTDKPKLEEIDKEEALKEMAENVGLNDVEEDVNEWGDDGDKDDGNKMNEIEEESVTKKQMQPTEYQMPQMRSAIQTEQQVQVDIQCSMHEDMIDSYKSEISELKKGIEEKKEKVLIEFERVRREFKAEQARVIEEMTEQFEEEKVEAEQEFEQERQHFEQVKYKLQEQLESSPGVDVIQKDVIDVSSENLYLSEDKDGNLQASHVKSNPSKAVEEVTLKEMVQNLQSINDVDKDDDDWEHVNEDGIHHQIQEESCIQQEVQLTEFSMSSVTSALRREQAVQVDILVYKPPDQFESKLAQTETTKLSSKQMQTLQVGGKDAAMQTFGKEIESRVTQTEDIKMKEMGVQLETLKSKNQSSQWEVSQQKVAVQTVPNDVSNVKTQTDHSKPKERGIQGDKLKTDNKACQWTADSDQLPISKPMQTEGNEVKHQLTQTAKLFKALTETKSVQVKGDYVNISSQTDTTERKDETHQVQITTDVENKSSQWESSRTETKSIQVKGDYVNISSQTDVTERKDKNSQVQITSDVENKSSQWESSYIRTKSVQTEDRDQMSVPSQTDDVTADYLEEEPLLHYHVSIAEQSVPEFTETATQSMQSEVLVSETGTSMESVAMLSRASQVGRLMMTDRSSQWERDESMSMSMQTEIRPRILSGVQTEGQIAREQGQQACVEQTHKAIQHQVDVQHDASQTSIFADVKATQTLLLTENQKLQTDRSIKAHRGSQSDAAMLHHSSSQASVTSKVEVTQTEYSTGDQISQTDSHVKKESRMQTDLNKSKSVDEISQTESHVKKERKMQTDLIKSKSVDANTQMTPVKRIEKQSQADLIKEKDDASPITLSEQKEQHAKVGLPEEKAVIAERAREEAIQMSSAQQLHAAHQDTGADKQQSSETAADNEEQTLTFVSSMDEQSSSETEGPDEILGPRQSSSETTEGPDEILTPRQSSGMSDSTLTPETSEGEVMGMLRKAPFFSSLLGEKKTRPKKERRRKRDRVRKLPDIPDQSRRRSRSTDGRYSISDETSGEEIGRRRSKKTSSHGRQLPTPPGSDSAKQEQPKRHPKISDIKERDKNMPPQRTHGELSSQDSLFSRLFTRQDSKIVKDVPSVDEEPPLQSSSVTFESASAPRSAPPSRPTDLGLAPGKSSTDAANPPRVTSPLTEQVTSQKDKLTQMLNLFRPDVKGQEQPKIGHSPAQRSTSLPSVPEQEFLHKKATTPLEAPRKAGDTEAGFELHPSSSQRLYSQKPSDGPDADKVQRSSSLPGQIDIKTDGSSQVKTTSLPDNRLKSSASDPRGMHPSTDRRQHTGGMHPTTDGREHPRGMHTGTDSRQHPATDGRLTGEVHPSTDGRQHTGVGTGMLSHKGPLHGTLAGLPNDRARIEMLEQNCDRLKHELSETGKKLLEAEMQISIAEAQRMRELQRLKDKQNRDTDKEVSKLKKDILEKDHVVRELEKALSMKADQLGQAANRSKDELNQEVKEMRDQKVELEKKYRNTQRLLDEYMRKLKEQLTRSTRSDVLVKELYVENSKLQKALQVTEERQKIAEKNCHNLREKNHAYLHVLRRIAPAAM
ncbi:uncharacterized protein [Amphiura filiformis]|uniref:uncharacterized protein isoform X2 n=1 Tax=Amphiura filiformis TaxID=82378 RepID=UPI003B2276AB